MKTYLLILIIVCLMPIIRCEVESKDYYDLNDDDQHVQVVQMIFSKLNTILNETAEVTKIIDGLNKRFNILDQRVDKLLQDFVKFKTDISQSVQEQRTSVQNTLSNTTKFNIRADELEKRLSTSSKDVSNIRNDVTKIVQDRNEAFRSDINQRFNQINQVLKQSSNDIEVFKADISKTVEGHSVALQHKVNESLQQQARQQVQIKFLLENSSLKANPGWIVILRRTNGSVDFNRNWTEYKNGFGYPGGEFFVGFKILYRMTANGFKHELLIEMKDADNHETYAKYDNFVIGNEHEKYILKKVGDFSGDAEDALTHHEGEKITTLDQDNDLAAGENCAQTHKGPWWFYQCNPSSHLFAPYPSKHLGPRMRWGPSILKELKFVEVKIRQLSTN